VAVLGGREGMSRSLGSVYGGSVTRFLGGGLRGIVSRVIATPGVRAGGSCMAVSRDGSTVLVSDTGGGSHAIHEFRVSDGSLLRVVGGAGDGPLQFKHPRQVWVASDDFVFVVDGGNHRVQVLTPRLDFHALVGVGELENPVGVCANDAVVVVSEPGRLSVFSRGDGALLRRIGSKGSGNGQLKWSLGLCFMSDGRHIAVGDNGNHRVSVFSVDGGFVRHVGVDVLKCPMGVACSAYDELVVADSSNYRVAVFSASGEMVKAMSGAFCGVAMHGGSIFAQSFDKKCVVFT
jgi:DNA-binding beta-propeller fold protein YncE